MKALTRYSSGSMAELWAVSWPLIIASAANMLMLFGDRIILAHYSQGVFNACVAAMPWVLAVYFPLYSIVSIAGVLVGRYNGAGTYHKIGPTVWQMLWLSLALLVPLIPLSWYLTPHLLADSVRDLGVLYLRIVMPSVPISLAAFGAMAAFFTGRGQTLFASAVALVCNLINLFVDVLLVFGIGPFPAMGICGAAWGTVIAQFVALLLFACFLFTKKNGKVFHVFDTRLNKKILKECFRIGSPTALGSVVNFLLWSWILQVMVNQVSADNFTAFGITTTLYHLFLFVIEGVSLGVGTIVANAYGAGAWDVTEKNTRSWIRVALAVVLITFVPMVLFSGPLLTFFLHGSKAESFHAALKVMLFFCWLMGAAECFSFNLRQILTVFGDTVFTTVVNFLGYACVVIAPSYFALRLTHHAASFLAVESVGQISIAVAFFIRYRRHWLFSHRNSA